MPSTSPVSPWCRHTINHLHKPLLWDRHGKKTKNSWHVQSFYPPLALDACDFHQECFIRIFYYMCCRPIDVKGSFIMWIVCSPVACETRQTGKTWTFMSWNAFNWATLLCNLYKMVSDSMKWGSFAFFLCKVHNGVLIRSCTSAESYQMSVSDMLCWIILSF